MIAEVIGWTVSTIALVFATIAAIHISQHVERPEHKMAWILLVAFIPIIGSLTYYFTKYSRFKQIGKGGLIYKRSIASSNFFRLSNAERAGARIDEESSKKPAHNQDDY